MRRHELTDHEWAVIGGNGSYQPCLLRSGPSVFGPSSPVLRIRQSHIHRYVLSVHFADRAARGLLSMQGPGKKDRRRGDYPKRTKPRSIQGMARTHHGEGTSSGRRDVRFRKLKGECERPRWREAAISVSAPHSDENRKISSTSDYLAYRTRFPNSRHIAAPAKLCIPSL
jgi:hypothetical protein